MKSTVYRNYNMETTWQELKMTERTCRSWLKATHCQCTAGVDRRVLTEVA